MVKPRGFVQMTPVDGVCLSDLCGDRTAHGGLKSELQIRIFQINLCLPLPNSLLKILSLGLSPVS